MVHHGNEKIEEDDDVDDGESPKHHKTPESRKFLLIIIIIRSCDYDDDFDNGDGDDSDDGAILNIKKVTITTTAIDTMKMTVMLVEIMIMTFIPASFKLSRLIKTRER